MTIHVALALLAAHLAAVPAAGQGALTAGTCTISGRPARCGTFTVPEVRGVTGGRPLALGLVVLARTASRSGEPLFVLAGGPGQAVTSLREFFAATFDAVRDRDIVLLDQRGTAGTHRLGCAMAEGTFFVPADPPRCAGRLQRTSDLTAYGTMSFVEDLEAARVALGYEQVSIYAGSYGTRAAYAYARRYPDRVRSLVLIAAAPLSMSVLDSFEEDGASALRAIVANCAVDRACGRAFPNVREALGTVQRDLADPYRVIGLRILAYSSDTARLIPLLVTRAAAGDRAPLDAAIERARGSLTEQLAIGLHLAIMCSEELPFAPDTQERATVLRGEYTRACTGWPRVELRPDFHQRVRLPHRALVIGGEWDPVTSPRWTNSMASQFAHSQVAIVPKSGHLLTGLERCLGEVTRVFLDGRDADLSCLVRASRPRFVLTLPRS